MAGGAGHFTIDDALDAINAKLIRRHPHVFGEETARHRGRREAHLGRDEGRRKGRARKRGADCWIRLPRALPALVEAQQITSRAAGAGFDWQNADQVLAKLDEELARIRPRPGATIRPRSWKTSWATCSSSW